MFRHSGTLWASSMLDGSTGVEDWRLLLMYICTASTFLALKCYESIKMAKPSKGCSYPTLGNIEMRGWDLLPWCWLPLMHMKEEVGKRAESI